MGTFVAGERIQATLRLASFTEDMRRRGLVAATIVRRAELVEAPVEARAALGLPEGGRAGEVTGLRLAGGLPMALEQGFHSEALLPGLDEHDLTCSLYTTLATTCWRGRPDQGERHAGSAVDAVVSSRTAPPAAAGNAGGDGVGALPCAPWTPVTATRRSPS